MVVPALSPPFWLLATKEIPEAKKTVPVSLTHLRVFKKLFSRHELGRLAAFCQLNPSRGGKSLCF